MPNGVFVGFPDGCIVAMVFAVVVIIILASITFRWRMGMREEHAAMIFRDAEQAQQAKNTPLAFALYSRLLADYWNTNYVSKQMKSTIDERILKLKKDDWLNGEV